MAALRRPVERVRDDHGNELATLADIAREINERFPPVDGRKPVSRQLLHKASKYRWRNKFPLSVRRAPGPNGGDGYALFRVEEVVQWYIDKRSYRIRDDDGDTALAA